MKVAIKTSLLAKWYVNVDSGQYNFKFTV